MVVREISCIFLCIFVLCSGVVSVDITENKVTDMGGNEVDIHNPISSIVCLDPFATQMVLAIGGGDFLSSVFLGPADKKVLHEIHAGVAELKSVGGPSGTNLESLTALKPDLVISSVGSDEMNQNIRDLGFSVIEVDSESPEKLIQGIQIIGSAIGRSEQADEFISWYTEKMDYIRKQTADVQDEDRKTVYIGGLEPLSTVGSDYYQHYLINNAGGKNIADGFTGGWNDVSLEQLYTWQPDVILFAPYSKISVEDLQKDPAWQKLTAVREGKVYRMPKYIASWDVPGPESVLGMMWLAEKMYPEKVNFAIEDEMRSFYLAFYDYQISDSTIDSILEKQDLLDVNPTIIY
jgi:iron complex transport system substrate-binding protein